MPIRYVSGDLFLSRAQTLAHGVNCQGRMGAGIAVEFRSRFPQMYQEYRRLCHRGELHPGQLFLWTKAPPWILNMATQYNTRGATPEAVEQALVALASQYENLRISSLAMPRLASGLGGLEWSDVRVLLEDKLGRLPIQIYLYEHYIEGVPAPETDLPGGH